MFLAMCPAVNKSKGIHETLTMSSTTSSSDCRDSSCPDCKAELYKRRWTKILVNWVNIHSPPNEKTDEFTEGILLDIMFKYMDDICQDDLERALLCSDDIEPFMKYKYPILRLRNTWDSFEVATHKQYTLASAVLYHCCVSSKTGAVEAAICQNLDSKEQELIVKFCENLGEMEVTINNVDNAINGAFETTAGVDFEKLDKKSLNKPYIRTCLSFDSAYDIMHISPQRKVSKPVIKFKSSVNFVAESSNEMKLSDHNHVSFGDGLKNMGSLDDSAINVFNFKEFEAGSDVPERSGGGKKTGWNDVLEPNDEEIYCCTPNGDAGEAVKEKEEKMPTSPTSPFTSTFNWVKFLVIIGVFALSILFSMTVFLSLRPSLELGGSKVKPEANEVRRQRDDDEVRKLRDDEFSTILIPNNLWECKNNVCQMLYEPTTSGKHYASHSRCALLCSEPYLWPAPIGNTIFGNEIVALIKNKLEYKFQTVPSEIVQEYLAEAFKFFLDDLKKLESIELQNKNQSHDLPMRKLYIQIDVESDPDPRLRLDTDESYVLKVEPLANSNIVKVTISSVSFCGVRHGLETLSQLILLDQRTGYLITLSTVRIKDGPSYRYRGLMIDTARNYIPVKDLMKTIDTMSSCKLNTFHWRISDATSFPLLLPDYPQLFDYGGYDRSMVYTEQDIKLLVKRAGVRGIRILIEVAAPGPVGKPWSWSPDTTCVSTDTNNSCHSDLCRRLTMAQGVFDVLENIYTFIIKLTKVDDIFHLSDGVFSFTQCFYVLDDREGFLDKALARLRIANRGFLPKLPVIWYTSHLFKEYEGRAWERFGVQVDEWQPNPSEHYLSKYKVIHSSRWELSCETRKRRCRKYRTWQEMYAWKSWRNLDVLTIEGGEATLWTDLVDSSNLDSHLWPRAAAVAERLWSDIVANHSARSREYLRLDAHRWRMLVRGVKVPPVWPVWCSLNPKQCLDRIA